MTKKRTCCVCKTEYEYCNTCPQMVSEPSWKQSFCCQSCKDVYEACAGYSVGNITAEESVALLCECDLSNYDNFSDSVKSVIGTVTAIVAPEEEEETGEELTEEEE